MGRGHTCMDVTGRVGGVISRLVALGFSSVWNWRLVGNSSFAIVDSARGYNSGYEIDRIFVFEPDGFPDRCLDLKGENPKVCSVLVVVSQYAQQCHTLSAPEPSTSIRNLSMLTDYAPEFSHTSFCISCFLFPSLFSSSLASTFYKHSKDH